MLPTAEIVAGIDAVDAGGRSAAVGPPPALIEGDPTLAALGPVDRIEPYDAIAARLR